MRKWNRLLTGPSTATATAQSLGTLRSAIDQRVVTAAMLPSHDVLDVEFHDRGVRLREGAVFPAVSCATSDQFANRWGHQEDGCLSKKLRALAWRIVRMSSASTSCLYSAFC